MTYSIYYNEIVFVVTYSITIHAALFISAQISILVFTKYLQCKNSNINFDYFNMELNIGIITTLLFLLPLSISATLYSMFYYETVATDIDVFHLGLVSTYFIAGIPVFFILMSVIALFITRIIMRKKKKSTDIDLIFDNFYDDEDLNSDSIHSINEDMLNGNEKLEETSEL